MKHHPDGCPPSGCGKRERSLEELAVTRWLDGENSRFFLKNGILFLAYGEEAPVRVTAARAFPFELPWEYVSLLDGEGAEVGLVRSLELLDGESREILRAELERRYHVRRINRILSVKERYGFSYWRVESDEGELRFTMRDTYRSILRVGEDRAFLLDVDGNRFEIPSLQALDRRSMRKIELYL